MNEKQERLINWLDSLGEYARSEGMPMRIVDRIYECRSSICENEADWDNIEVSVRDILDSIELKRNPSAKALENPESECTVTNEQIKKELEGITDRCRSENDETIRNYSALSKDIVEEVNGRLADITNVDVNYDKICRSSLYMEEFSRQRDNYKNKLLDMSSSLLDNITRNYDFMFDNIRKMFSNPSLRSSGISGERIYNSYDTRRESVSREALSAIEKSDDTGSSITRLASETCSEISRIRERAEKRRKKLLLIPALVIGAVIILIIVINIIGASGGSSSGGSQDNSLWDITKNVTEIAQGVSFLINSLPGLLITAAVIIGVIAVAYAVYGKMLRKRCNEEIKSGCRECLKRAMNKFRDENSLGHELYDTLGWALKIADSKYAEILSEIFSSPEKESTSEIKETDAFILLKEEWAEIKAL